MLKKYLIFFVAICSQMMAFAQGARALLDEAAAKYKADGTIKVNFTLDTIDKKAKLTHSQDGTATLNQDNFIVDIPDARAWFNGKTQWVLVKDLNEVNISNPSGNDLLAITPSVVFSLYKQGFKIKLADKQAANGNQVIELDAKDKKSEIQKIIIEIANKTKRIQSIKLLDLNDIENKLTLNSYEVLKDFDVASFTFNPKQYEDVEIVDLR